VRNRIKFRNAGELPSDRQFLRSRVCRQKRKVKKCEVVSSARVSIVPQAHRMVKSVASTQRSCSQVCINQGAQARGPRCFLGIFK